MAGQLAGTLENGIGQATELEDAVAQIVLEFVQRRLSLGGRNFPAKNPQSHGIDDFEFSECG